MKLNILKFLSGRLIYFIPVAVFLLFAAISTVKITTNFSSDLTANLPSPFINQLPPVSEIPILDADHGNLNTGYKFDLSKFHGKITLVNFWGSWCPPCRLEHPQLIELSKDSRINLVGINFKDTAENAIRFLNSFGNPFQLIGFDKKGRAQIDWGVFGPPETFILDQNGIVRFKFIGPITPESLTTIIKPEINRLMN